MNAFFDALSTLAPTVAGLLFGKAGEVGSAMAIKAVGNVFGVEEDAVVAALDSAINSSNPDERVKLLEAERLLKADWMRHAEQMRALDIDEYRVHTADRGSARQMMMATHDRTPERLAYLSFAGFLGISALVLWKGLPTDQNAAFLVGTLLTSLFTLAKDCFAFFTGASPSRPEANQQPNTTQGVAR